jgi:hypothetical protein
VKSQNSHLPDDQGLRSHGLLKILHLVPVPGFRPFFLKNKPTNLPILFPIKFPIPLPMLKMLKESLLTTHSSLRRGWVVSKLSKQNQLVGSGMGNLMGKEYITIF